MTLCSHEVQTVYPATWSVISCLLPSKAKGMLKTRGLFMASRGLRVFRKVGAILTVQVTASLD